MEYMRKIKHIVAVGENWGFSFKNKLIFQFKEILEHFIKMTSGHIIIMGRKTFEYMLHMEKNGFSIPGAIIIVVSRNRDYSAKAQMVTSSIEEAIEIAQEINLPKSDIYIMGGASMYNQTIDTCDELVIIMIGMTREADTFYLNPTKHGFKRVSFNDMVLSEFNQYPYSFTYWRKKS